MANTVDGTAGILPIHGEEDFNFQCLGETALYVFSARVCVRFHDRLLLQPSSR